MSEQELVDVERLRSAVQTHYAEVAEDPTGGDLHFHTGRAAASRLGYDEAWFDEPAGVMGDESVSGPVHVEDKMPLRPACSPAWRMSVNRSPRTS